MPAAAGAPPAPSEKPRPVASPNADAKVILVAEDDASIRDLIVRTLGGTYTIYVAEDGREALDLLELITPPPSAIVSDLMMPRLDGWALAKKLKADNRLKTVPLIFLTSRDAPLDIVQGINAGARHYVTKPFKMSDLVDKVAKAVR